jgi:hypothetical protein
MESAINSNSYAQGDLESLASILTIEEHGMLVRNHNIYQD